MNFVAVCANANLPLPSSWHQLMADNKRFSKIPAPSTLPPSLLRRSRSARRLSFGSVTRSPTISRRTHDHRFLRLRSSTTSVASILSRPRNLALILRRPTCIGSHERSRSSCPTYPLHPPLPARPLPLPAASAFSGRLAPPSRPPSARGSKLRLARSASG